MFKKILIANRGAVAARVLRACGQLGIPTVAVYSEADRNLPYLALATQTYALEGNAATDTYLNQDRLLEVLRESGADAVHPGYGFLSEKAEFAERVIAAGAEFIGPSPRWLRAMGHKTRARELMAAHGMPMVRSSGLLGEDAAANLAAAHAVGYPVLVKPAGGGGGIGMFTAGDDAQLASALERARTISQRSFGDAELYLEQWVERPRHIEFQILADRKGRAMHLFERDCSVQRRHQKVIEEAAAPGLTDSRRLEAANQMARIMGELGYDNIGTVETLYNPRDGSFNFLEVNTRLQVEHAVTEEVTGVDLVVSQIRLAAGADLDEVVPRPVSLQGHAVQARIYAEDPVKFFPSPGHLAVFDMPGGEGVRVETGHAAGCDVTPYYDPMVAKIICHGKDRAEAIARLDQALAMTDIQGIKTNLPFLRKVLAHEPFLAGEVHTGMVEDVLKAGAKR